MKAAPVLAALALVAAAALLTTCGDSVEPPVPGWVNVRLTTPNADDGGILFTVAGAQVDSVRLRFVNTFMRRESESSVRVVVAGTLSDAVVVAQVLVPDVNTLEPYTLTIHEVASRTFQQRSPSGYTLELVEPTQ